MREDTARKIANALLATAAVGVTYYVVRTPHLRRLASRLALTALTGTVPAWFAREVQHAWVESGRRA